MSYKHLITEVVEGGLDSDHLWARNSPEVVMYPSKETMV
jgi:hypothetical protein